MAKFGDIEFERRVFPRFILHLPFTYQIEVNKEGDDGGKPPQRISLEETGQTSSTYQQPPGTGITANASQGGLMVYLPEKVAVGDRIKVRLLLADQGNVNDIETVTEVRWVTKTTLGAPRLYKAGIRFLDITEESLTFLKWFEQLWLEQSG